MPYSVPQSGAEGGQVYTKLASVITSEPFKAAPPMSDENETNNPYQPPTLSDEPLAKKDADGAQAKLDPIHWQVPWLGYGYVPLVIGLISISYDPPSILYPSGLALLLLLPVYGLFIFKLTAQRNQQGTNSVGLTLFQMLSIVPLILWGLFCVWGALISAYYSA